MNGSLLIVEAEDITAVEAFVADDPYCQAGLFETVVIRPPWFYGPGQPPRQTLFFTMIRTGRMPIVGGNWKMNMDLATGVELAEDLAAACADSIDRCEVAIFPPFPYLQAVGKALELLGRNCVVGAFIERIDVSHTHRLVETLNERTKKVTAAAEARRLRLVKDDP